MESISKVLKKHKEIVFGYLYGSVAKDQCKKDSDIDIGIFLKEDFKKDINYEIKLAMEIEEKTNLKNVEVVVLNNKNLRFVNQVLKYGKLIFSRDEKKRIAFETLMLKKYIDFKPHFIEYDKMRLKRLKI
ncbi:MAG: nucleotidyltransferase domain-containing protein [Candidatus Aenigmatarchaeota archaeon]